MAMLSFFPYLLSQADQQARNRAEEEYKNLQRTRPQELAEALTSLCEPNSSPPDRQLALVLLRQTLKCPWSQEGAKLAIGERLLHLLAASQNEHDDGQIIKAFVAIPGASLQGFTNQVISIVNSGGAKAIMLAESFAEFAFSPVIIAPFEAAIKQCFSAGDAYPVKLQLTAVKTAVALVMAANEAGQIQSVQTFASAIPGLAIRSVVRAVVTNYDNASAIESAMEQLVTLAETCGWALDASLGENCNMLLEICENTQVAAPLRALSMTVVGSIMARKGSSASKDTAFATRIIRCALQLQTQDEDFEADFDEDVCPDEDDILGTSQSGLRGASLDTLMQLSHGSAGISSDAGNFLMLLLAQVKPLLSSSEWMSRVAALSTVACIAQPLEKPLKPFLNDIVSGVSKMVAEDSNARVRLSAAGCLCSLLAASKKTGKDIRKNMHGVVVPALGAALTSANGDSTATKCSVLMGICQFYGGTSRKSGEAIDDQENDEEVVVVPKAAITPYLNSLVTALLDTLQATSKPPIQERSMEALTALGTQAKADFGKFYTVLVPGLKSALQSATDGAVKTAAMILVATCAETVGKECFAKDATDIVGWFLSRHQQQNALAPAASKEETSELQGLFHFCERVAAVLESDFEPFMPHILPLVCRAALADLGISVSEDLSNVESKERVEQDEESGQATAVTKLRGVGQLEISANIYAFQLRESALQLIDALAEAGCIKPQYLDDCVNALIPNVTDRTCTAGLNVAAAEASASVFNAACECQEVVVPVRALVALGTPLISGLAFDSPTPYTPDEIDRRSAFAAAFERMTRICHLTNGRVKPPTELTPHIIQVLINAVSGSLHRRSNCFDELKVQGFEAEAIQSFGEEIVEDETALASDLVDALGYLLKNDPVTVWPHFQESVLPFMVGFLDIDTHGDVNLTHNALCCFVDALEFGGDDARVAQASIPNLKKALFRSESKLRQVAAYGLGVAAQKITSDDWVDDVIRALGRSLTVKDAKSDDMIVATENIVAALGKFYVRNPSKHAELLKIFAQNMPLLNDALEAEFAHGLFFKLTLEGTLPSGFEAQLLTTCAQLIQHKLHKDDSIELCDDVTFAQIPTIVAKIKTQVGAQPLMIAIQGLPSEDIDDEVKMQLASM